MIMVSIGTFSWESLLNLKKHPPSTNTVMIATVIVVVFTHNLALGVLVGVLLAGIFFANKISRYMLVETHSQSDTERTYKVIGQVFFATADQFINALDFKEVLTKVVIDVSEAHFWDITAVAALDKAVIKFRREGAEVAVVGLNEASATIIDRLGVHDKPEEVEKLITTP